MRRLFFAGDDADVDSLESGFFEPALQVRLRQPQPPVPVQLVRFFEAVLRQVEDHQLAARLQEKFPGVPAQEINFIQQERMLLGEQGTGWYYAAWHRGSVGQNKKLIAYCPIQLGTHPPRIWSVAVVALESEVEDALHSGSARLLALVAIVILTLILGGTVIYLIENRWGKVLESLVLAKTDALAKSEENYRSLVESAEDLIFTVDPEGRFQSLNTFTARFFGGHPEQFIGRHLASAFPKPTAARQVEMVRRVQSSGKSAREEFELPVIGPMARGWV